MPVRSTRRAPSPIHAAGPGKVLGRSARARRPQIGAASVSGAHGDYLAAVPRASRLRALRILHGIRLRGTGQVLGAVHHDPEAEATGRCEVRADSYVYRWRAMRAAAPPRALLRSRQARPLPKGARRRLVRNGAETPDYCSIPKTRALATGSRIRAAWWAKYLMFNQGASAHAVSNMNSTSTERASDAHPA